MKITRSTNLANITTPLICVILFIIAPLLSMPLLVIVYLRNQKYRWFYSLLIGLSLGIVAYYLLPSKSFDLYRHHESLSNFKNLGLSEIIKGSEPIASLWSSLIFKTGNFNLLQYSVVSTGYWIILYIIGDYASKIKLSTTYLCVVLTYALSAFTAISFMSGLWNYLGILVFTLGLYWDIVTEKRRKLAYIMYAVTPFIHSSMYFIVLILLVNKTLGKKNKSILAILTLMFIFPAAIIALLNKVVGSDSSILLQINLMYNSYFFGKSQLEAEYGARIILMELLKLIPVLIVSLLFWKNDSYPGRVSLFVLSITVSVIMLVPQSVIFLRFIMLAVFIGTILIAKYFAQEYKPYSSILIIVILLSSLVFMQYQILMFRKASFDNLIPRALGSSIFTVFKKGNI
jgi:hypothetical protein